MHGVMSLSQQHLPECKDHTAGMSAGVACTWQHVYAFAPRLLLLLQMRARRLALPLLLEFAGWWAAAVWVEGHAALPAALRFGCGYATGMLMCCVLELRSRERFAATLDALAADACAAQGTACTSRGGSVENTARAKARGLHTSSAARMSSTRNGSHAD
jgi:hypothetical protein